MIEMPEDIVVAFELNELERYELRVLRHGHRVSASRQAGFR
jgi:hypothetical protein